MGSRLRNALVFPAPSVHMALLDSSSLSMSGGLAQVSVPLGLVSRLDAKEKLDNVTCILKDNVMTGIKTSYPPQLLWDGDLIVPAGV